MTIARKVSWLAILATLTTYTASAAETAQPTAQPPSAAPSSAPPAPPIEPPSAPQARGTPPGQPPEATSPDQVPQSGGQWAYTQEYGWVWMPYGDQYVSSGGQTPYAYVYEPSAGWTWLAAPWVYGVGTLPYFTYYGPWQWGWYWGGLRAGWFGYGHPWFHNGWGGWGRGYGYGGGWGGGRGYGGGWGGGRGYGGGYGHPVYGGGSWGGGGGGGGGFRGGGGGGFHGGGGGGGHGGHR